ncbi:methionine synthase [Prochlorococcus sp. MIT 1300]|uniref:methionine synthase n=1 Tax=Prochlorococcus sp. MIT 1300 TaxID=3096218 RepID=UPI002A76231E|nr:methionine synthase [Prochlorococcus sp. MIT 1300]
MTPKNTNHTSKNIDLLEYLNGPSNPVLVFDGATGTSLQQLNLCAEDFGGPQLEGCNENLVISSPGSVEKVHRQFLDVGCDVIETNTFGATSIVLAEYGLESETYKINLKASQLAKTLAADYSTSKKPRFVAGSIGPTTKLPTLSHISFDELRDSYKEQVEGLIDGGVDLLLIETCQDLLQIKSVLNAIEQTFTVKSKRLPVMVSVTMETTGTMLVGSDIATVVTTLEPYQIDILGLNCATGPEQMKEHIKYLSKYSPFLISCIPNAGLPENVGGIAHYRLSPIELKMQLMHFVEDLGVRVIGGCCGTTPDHISALAKEVRNLNPAPRSHRNGKEHLERSLKGFEPSASSIYSSTTFKQDNSFLIVGERLNASGSKKARELLNLEDWDGLVALARNQVKENAHILDINVDYVGRDGVKDMNSLVKRLVTNINLPLMLDSTEWQKMESGLKVAGGKCILNSTNFEDGDERFYKVVEIARSYGASIVVGTIDEEGMARTSSKKFEIAQRAFQACINSGIPEHEIFYDPLALPISTGIEEDRLNAFETIKAIKLIRNHLPNVHIILGISNISFGLSPAARITLNSVFLNDCYEAGLDAAIISPSKILPLSKINPEHQKICRDLIYDRREYNNSICQYDPLTKLTSVFEGVSTSQARSSSQSLKELAIEERLKVHIIDGERIGLDEALSIALEKYKPLEIINKYLLDGMREVGELFGSGQMQLPFVLQSAQTMKFAVSFLEPYMEKSEGDSSSKGKFLIATVKGDVHDIGKNLVDIILTNNGYEVINLGIKQDVKAIIEAQNTHQADCIAMSGLLVKSTAFMKDNLQAFNEAGISVPVVLGGAALTPKFVNGDCSEIYKGKVLYGKDAFTDLRFMDEYITAKANGNWNDFEGFKNGSPEGINLGGQQLIESNCKQPNNLLNDEKHQIEAIPNLTISTERSITVPEEKAIQPPFIGSRVLSPAEIPIEQLVFYLDKQALFSGQWQIKRNKNQSSHEYKAYLEKEINPILEKWIDLIISEQLILPSAVYGYYPCGRNDNSLRIYDEDSNKELAIFNFPRQKGGNKYCISDYYLDLNNNGPLDFLPMQAVTVGDRASQYAQKLFKSDNYLDYLYFHGLSVQLAEALAEFVHSRIRIECGFSNQEPNEIKDILAQRYRGCRYSFGYPACPNVSDSRIQLSILKADRIGLTMDKSDQLHPEQSTTALIALHSNARYFAA